jgi:hypothetical protein
LVDYR